MITLAEERKLHPLYYVAYHRCVKCQEVKVSSAVQISDKLTNRQQYYCQSCAVLKGYSQIHSLAAFIEGQSYQPAPVEPRSQRRVMRRREQVEQPRHH